MIALLLPWILALLLMGSATATDIPFVFDEKASDIASYTSDQLKKTSANSPKLAGVPQVSELPDNQTIEIYITGGGERGPATKVQRRVSELREIFDARVEPFFG